MFSYFLRCQKIHSSQKMIFLFLLLATFCGATKLFCLTAEKKEIGYYCCNNSSNSRDNNIAVNDEKKKRNSNDDCTTCCEFTKKPTKQPQQRVKTSSQKNVGAGANNIAWLISSGVLMNAAQQLSLEIANEANAYPLPDASGQDGCLFVRRLFFTLV